MTFLALQHAKTERQKSTYENIVFKWVGTNFEWPLQLNDLTW